MYFNFLFSRMFVSAVLAVWHNKDKSGSWWEISLIRQIVFRQPETTLRNSVRGESHFSITYMWKKIINSPNIFLMRGKKKLNLFPTLAPRWWAETRGSFLLAAQKKKLNDIAAARRPKLLLLLLFLFFLGGGGELVRCRKEDTFF